VIDDTKMHTLASASTKQKPISEEFDYTSGPTIVSSSLQFINLGNTFSTSHLALNLMIFLMFGIE